MSVKLEQGDASAWVGEADMVLTNPYAPLPMAAVGLPMLITHFSNRKTRCEDYVNAELFEIGRWGNGLTHSVWVANTPAFKVEVSDLVEEEFEPGRGWFPPELPLRLLREYAVKGSTILDPFMGRGTVGKACQQLGLNFIGIDRDPARVEIAREYLGCSPSPVFSDPVESTTRRGSRGFKRVLRDT